MRSGEDFWRFYAEMGALVLVATGRSVADGGPPVEPQNPPPHPQPGNRQSGWIIRLCIRQLDTCLWHVFALVGRFSVEIDAERSWPNASESVPECSGRTLIQVGFLNLSPSQKTSPSRRPRMTTSTDAESRHTLCGGCRPANRRQLARDDRI